MMSPRHKKRIAIVAFIVIGVSSAVALAVNAFRENLMYFYSPSEVVAGAVPQGQLFRLGGLVEHGTVERDPQTLVVRFGVTDTAKSVVVTYSGILPDLFREGQGVVTHGRMNESGVFVAQQVLAKHDETYMPPEVAGAINAAQAQGGHPSREN